MIEVVMDKYDVLKLDNQLCFPLYALSREIINLYKPYLDKLNLTYTQYVTMLVIWEEKKIVFKELGKKLHLDSGTLTPVLKKLESMGLIEKYRTKEDDRVVMIELTEKGSTLKNEVLEIPEKIACQLKIDKNEAIQFKSLVDKMLNKLS